MKPQFIFLAIAAFIASPACATEPQQSTPMQTCELTCQYKEGNGPKRIVSCTPHMTEAQCTATADHKNLNDAYPNKMSCAAKRTNTCVPERVF